MIRRIAAILPVAFALLFTAASNANEPLAYDVTLCQQAVAAQIKLEHAKAKIEFNDQETKTSKGASGVMQVTGHGHFVKNDDTHKKFNYACDVNTAEKRVLSASYKNKD